MEQNLILKKIDTIDTDVAQLTVSLMQPPRPSWARLDTPALRKSTHQAIRHIIANTELPPMTQFPLAEQRLLFKRLDGYAQLLTTAVMNTVRPNPANTQDYTNKEALNKKIITAKKFFKNALEFIYNLQNDNAYQKKIHKKLMKYLAYLDYLAAKKSTEAAPEYTPAPVPNSVLIPPEIKPIPDPTDEDLAEQLEKLGLKLGATHADIDNAFHQLKAEFEANPSPSPAAQAERLQVIAIAHATLMSVNASRLASLPAISPQQVERLGQILQAHLPHLLNTELRLTDIRKAYVEYGIQSATSDSPEIQGQLRTLNLAMQKLEHQFGADPQKKIHLGREFLPALTQASASKTPTPSPSPKKI